MMTFGERLSRDAIVAALLRAKRDRASTTLSSSAHEGTEADLVGPRRGEQLQWVLRIAIRASTFAAVTGTQGTK
jgi:hypothetical protein